MRTYENQVQLVKSEVYKKVAKYAFLNQLEEKIASIPAELYPGPEARYRCCVHHERAITQERIAMLVGGNKDVNIQVEVLPSACDHCQENRYVVTEACRSCLAHRCQQSCPRDAISIVDNRAYIDQSKCIECGKCYSSCPYDAIADVKRPCIKACPTNAIQIDAHKKAIIDESKCIECGTCVYHCPFGAIQEKSQMVSVIDELKGSKPVYAIIAPAIATQFNYISLGKVITAIKKLGFKDVVEVALGADMVAIHEAEEVMQRLSGEEEVVTTSCCPAFVELIKLKYPEMIGHISSTISPMVATARFVKDIDPEAVVVFVGPCIAKKSEEERQLSESSVDYVLVFEELNGMIHSLGMDLESLEESPLNNASYYGRGFAASGGVSEAVKEALRENSQEADVNFMVCDGVEACEKALKLAKVGHLKNTFIEGMACKGGCIKGPVTMHYGATDKRALSNYCKEALEEDVSHLLRMMDLSHISLER